MTDTKKQPYTNSAESSAPNASPMLSREFFSLFLRDGTIQNAAAVERISGNEVDGGDRGARIGGDVSIRVRFRKKPPQRDEKDGGSRVYERPGKGDRDLVFEPYPLYISRNERAVGHEHDFIQPITEAGGGEGVPAFVHERDERRHEKEKHPARYRVIYSEQKKERMYRKADPPHYFLKKTLTRSKQCRFPR